MRLRLACVMAVLPVVSLGACGRLGPDEGAPLRVIKGQRYVTARDIQRYPPGSPQAVVLEWWRALQRNDAPAALRLYSRKVHITAPEFLIQRSLGGLFLSMLNRIVVKDVDRVGGRTTVFLFRERVIEVPNGRNDIVGSARGFTLVRERGRWRLADNLFLGRVAAVGAAAQGIVLRR
jgi:hypothetical protein